MTPCMRRISRWRTKSRGENRWSFKFSFVVVIRCKYFISYSKKLTPPYEICAVLLLINSLSTCFPKYFCILNFDKNRKWQDRTILGFINCRLNFYGLVVHYPFFTRFELNIHSLMDVNNEF